MPVPLSHSTDPDRLIAQTTALFASDRLTAPTRDALMARLTWRRGETTALSARQIAVLDTVARLLVPLGALDDAVDLAGRLDADLMRGTGDGWRYAALPADREALGLGLDRLDADGFEVLGADAQYRYLDRVRLSIEG